MDSKSLLLTILLPYLAKSRTLASRIAIVPPNDELLEEDLDVHFETFCLITETALKIFIFKESAF